MYIPTDAAMLLSMINMKLRDEYGSLQSLCDDLELSQEEIEEKLSTIGYRYDEDLNRFCWVIHKSYPHFHNGVEKRGNFSPLRKNRRTVTRFSVESRREQEGAIAQTDMSEYDLMKLFSAYDGEISMGDFTPDELQEYLAYADGEEQPLSPAEWKAKYFEYYDDVKDKSLKKQDW